MKRAERLYALVDLLRARSPRTVPVSRLATELAVSTRTIERDLRALEASGVPVFGVGGRTGGVGIAPGYSLPPLHLTVDEATAVLAGLALLHGSPFAAAARTSRAKVAGVLPPDVREQTERSLRSVYAISVDAISADAMDAQAMGAQSSEQLVPMGVPIGVEPSAVDHHVRAVGRAVRQRELLSISYRDRNGVPSDREVEPMALLSTPDGWLLVGWCRMRRGVRGFRLDRLTRAERRPGVLIERPQSLVADDLARFLARRLDESGGNARQ